MLFKLYAYNNEIGERQEMTDLSKMEEVIFVLKYYGRVLRSDSSCD